MLSYPLFCLYINYVIIGFIIFNTPVSRQYLIAAPAFLA
jgi:hypothetical protein